MKQPKKVKKQPDLKRRLEQAAPAQEEDVAVTILLPPSIVRSIEAIAGKDIAGWVRDMVVDVVEGEIAANELLDEE